MSVQINQYMGYGYMLDYKEAKQALIDKWGEAKYEELIDQYHDSAFDNKIVEISGCSLISDGCSGKFIFFGKIFNKAKDGYHLNTQKLEKVKKHIRLTVDYEAKAVFGQEFIEAQEAASRYLITLER